MGGCFNLQNNIQHCGSCNASCPAASSLLNVASVACSRGACAIRCNSGFHNCDGQMSNGCEVGHTRNVLIGSMGRALQNALYAIRSPLDGMNVLPYGIYLYLMQRSTYSINYLWHMFPHGISCARTAWRVLQDGMFLRPTHE
jgi:hypothetical protein